MHLAEKKKRQMQKSILEPKIEALVPKIEAKKKMKNYEKKKKRKEKKRKKIPLRDSNPFKMPRHLIYPLTKIRQFQKKKFASVKLGALICGPTLFCKRFSFDFCVGSKEKIEQSDCGVCVVVKSSLNYGWK